jgi:hypothetical protein
MAAEFHANRDLTRDLCNELAGLEPHNPFRTLAYANAMRDMGTQPWLLCLKEKDRIVGGCLGFLKVGRLNRILEIPSVPFVPPGSLFWTGLVDFCHKTRVSELLVNSFASKSADIPMLPGEMGRRTRVEYTVPLFQSDLLSAMSSNHRRNSLKAQKAGVLIERSKTVEACQDHAGLQDMSMVRRMRRGEQVAADAEVRTSFALLEHQAGELFRATCGGEILSSILILRASKGAYYHSAGTSSKGMASGASHFLIRQVAEILREEGLEQFNLGGADANNPGLERFKKGFGAQEVLLEAAGFCLASPLRRKTTAAIRSLRDDPLSLIHDLTGRVERYCVYCCKPEDIGECAAPIGAEFRKIPDQELLHAARQHTEMQMYKKKYEQFGINDAYGVYVDGVLAHVSWLVPADHDRLCNDRNVKLLTGEAEITHAATLGQFRNRGLYTYAIRCLVGICRQQKIRRVYMITGRDNLASQKGIEKAGLRPAGRIWRVKYRHLGGRSLVIRGHRLLRLFSSLMFLLRKRR